MKKLLSILALGIVAAMSLTAGVITTPYNYSGNTATDPSVPPDIEVGTWTRPDETDTSILSAFGVGIGYHAFQFTILTGGTLTFYSDASAAPNNFDNVLYLYDASFNAAAPTTGVLAVNDLYPDELNPTADVAGFTQTLAAGTYWLVTTGYANSVEFGILDEGDFANSITGTLDPPVGGDVPEPASFALLGGGLLALGMLARRRQRA